MGSHSKVSSRVTWARSKRLLALIGLALPGPCARAHAQTTPAPLGGDRRAIATVASGPAEQRDPARALGASSAALRTGRILLLDAPVELERALETALSPWGLLVESVAHAKPGSTLPGTALHASTMARELDASALIWLSSNTDGTALWLYEQASDTIVARPVPNQPMNESLAAALALSIKTWLRMSEPRAETEAPPSAPPVTSTPIRLDTPPVTDSAPVLDAPVADEAARARIIIYTAARRGAAPEPGVTELRYGLEVRASAWQSRASGTQLWLGLRLQGGTPSTASSDVFRGTYSELGAGVSAGISQRLASWVDLGLYASTIFSQASLYGTFLDDGSAAEQSRLTIAAQMGPELELSLGPLGIIVQPTLGALVRRRRYLDGDAELLETGRFWWMLGGGLRMNVF
jgi:hypothetical protein